MASIREIAKLLNINHDFDQDLEVDQVSPIDNYESFSRHTLSWVSTKRSDILNEVKRGVIVCPIMDIPMFKEDVVLLMVEKPRLGFLKVLIEFFSEEEEIGISKSAYINESAEVGQDCTIGHNVVVEHGCKLGNNCRVGHNTVIKSYSVISNDVVIGSNCTIGGVGFGYEQDEYGNYTQIPHIGNVQIESNVEIGNNVCIDRAVLGSTLIQQNAKVDNLVHIAHGVNIGRNSLIIANSMVAGSVTIGQNSWIAPSSSILNKTKIGNNVIIGMAAVVLKDVEDSDVVAGIPAKSIRKK